MKRDARLASVQRHHDRCFGALVDYYPLRRSAAAPKQRLPLRWYIMTIMGAAVVTALALNVVGIVIHPGPGPLAIATIFVISYASVAFIGTYSTFLWD